MIIIDDPLYNKKQPNKKQPNKNSFKWLEKTLNSRKGIKNIPPILVISRLYCD